MEHKHKWNFVSISWYESMAWGGHTTWACECGAVKAPNIKHEHDVSKQEGVTE